MKELKSIKEFLQQVADAFAAVLPVELAIIDSDLEVISGTGRYKREIGVVYEEGCMTDRIVRSPQDKCILVQDTNTNEHCSNCMARGECGVLAFSMCPIVYKGNKIGTISLLALNPDQKRALLQNYRKNLNFLNNVASFIVTTLNERDMKSRVMLLANQFEMVINTVHEGIIAINDEGIVTSLNRSARNIFGLEDDIVGEHINRLFPDFKLEKFMGGSNENRKKYYEWDVDYQTPDGRHLQLISSVSMILEDSVTKGAVISFRPREEIKKLASRFMGEDKYTLTAIKGLSKEILDIKKRMQRVAGTDSTILIRGETGTGKSLFARAIHEESYRSNRPFLAVNCAAIPASLLESELFGYEEGAFTGAKKGGKPGKFELAHGGTIFLDEIGDMPLEFQVELLQVIETKRIERIGSVRPREADVRIITATNQNLEELIKKGNFREDLYYRLNVIPFFIPPLRERQEDINLLMYHFLDLYTGKLKKNIKDFSPAAKKMLMEYSWPGNIRELENAIEYAVNIETGRVICPESLPERVRNYRKGRGEEAERILSLKDLEKRTIIRALNRYGYNTSGKEKAALALGISRATLYRKMKEYHIEQRVPY